MGLLTVIFLSSEETCETQETKETVQFACQHNLSLTDDLVTRVSLALGGKQREVLGTKLFCLALLFFVRPYLITIEVLLLLCLALKTEVRFTIIMYRYVVLMLLQSQ